MRNMIVAACVLFYFQTAFSESWIYSDNTVTTGKVTINGRDVGDIDDFIKGSGIKRTINREVEDFLSFSSRGAFQIKYKQGPLSLTISGDDNIIDHVQTEVVAGKLDISIDKSYQSKHPIVLTLSSEQIESVAIHGTSDAELDAIDSEQLKLDLSGTVNIFANGKVSRLQIKINGTGDVKLKSLVAQLVSVDLHGTGDVELTADEQLDAKIFGVGNIIYYGSPPQVNKHIFGVGNILAGN